MIIQSSFRDYYDHLAKYGTSEPIYKRYTSYHEEKIDIDFPSFLSIWTYCSIPSYILDTNIYYLFIGFCNKVFVTVNISTINEGSHFFYDESSLFDFIKLLGPKYHKSYIDSKRKLNSYQERFDRFFKVFQDNNQSILKSVKHISDKYPIFALRKKQNPNVYSVTTNCSLRQVDFSKVYDSYTVFQELEMWISNKALPEKPIPSISNEDMIACKGFDKYSFRKDKS